MKRGQLSLEYLILFSLGLGLLLTVLPILSRARDISRASVKNSELDSLTRDLSTGCEEALVTRDSVRIDISSGVNLVREGDQVMVKMGNQSSKVKGSRECSFSEEGEEILIKGPVSELQ